MHHNNNLNEENETMKKKSIALLLSAILATSVLSGCGSVAETQETTQAVSEEVVSEETAASAETQEVAQTVEETKLDLNGTKITFWHAMGGVNGEHLIILLINLIQKTQVESQSKHSIREAMMMQLIN